MPFAKEQALTAKAVTRDAWLGPGRFAILLGLLTFAAFPQILLGLQTFVFRDFGLFAYPIAYHWRESFWHGEIPLWNPLTYCGLPFLAEWNTQVLYPPALFYLLFPLSWSLGVFCLLHLFLGGWGMYFLARRWTQSCFAAAFAGIVFAFNGLMLNSLIWPATIPGLAWMPWVVWFTERAWSEGGRTVIIAAFVGALQMLSGAVEVVWLTWGLLGALGLARLIRGGLPRGAVFRRAVLVVLLISGLCAAQLLPFFDLLSHSHRQGNFDAIQWPMPKTGWLNFFLPLFHCHFDQGVFMQDNQYWTSSYYVGVTTMALAGWALWRARCRQVWLLSGLTGCCLVLALGDALPVYGWVCRHVGFIGLMRFPVKFVILPVLALPLLAAYGLAASERVPDGEVIASNRRWLRICITMGVLILGVMGWNCRVQPLADAQSAMVFNGLVRVIFFMALVAGLLLLRRISNFKLLRALQLLLLLLVWLDLYRQAPLPQTVSRAVYTPDLWPAASTPRLGVARAVTPPSARDQFITTHLPDPTDEYLSRRVALFMNCNLLDGVPKSDGFFPLYLREQAMLFSSDLSDPMLDFIGASQVLCVQTNTFSWKPRQTFMPLLAGGQKPVFTNDEAILQILASTNFHPRQEVYLPLAARAAIAATNSAAVKILSPHFSAQHLEASVQAAAPAMLVVAQMYYHPWRAYVDGRSTPLWRANYNFQALEVPAGSHQVRLVYQDRQFESGAIVSLTTLAGCLLALGFHRCRTGRAGACPKKTT